MIDVARHFISIDYLKRHIERMALFKLNKLHLHLTDDQGWRIEIKAYPKLTSIGSTTQVNGGGGGFYSQEQLRDLVSFAQLHGIEIIPEIDMPGHIQAAIASYNELACADADSLELYEGMRVGWSSLCLDKPEVIYPFVTNVLSEVVDIFPTQYIHIGGDEIEHDRYAEFIERADNILQNLGRKTIAWEEASKGELDSDSLLQLWNDEYDIQSAIDRNIHLVLSPCSYTYFDHGNIAGQENTFDWCTKDGVSLERVYSFKPENYPLVVGIEAPLWTEMVVDNAGADNRLWPRLTAISEVAWSAEENRDFAYFEQRLTVIKSHLDALQINYYGK
jgi:hexosaminidase